ncbi:MAG: type II toxin-antitoxin system Phd/YefM family antitoxin [Alphaproteobacteria bacterium]|nr:type II toxin-antitoxin system Phd/YefM family antitoxin [Alphaproteobacteria bacterium]
MTTVTIHAAKTQLSKLLARVEAGEEVVIARGKTPIAKLVPLAPTARKRQPGSMKGLIKLDDSFFDPLPEEELKAWEGG